MRQKLFVAVLLLITTGALAQDRLTNLLKVDHRSLVSTADLTYDTPVSRSEEGMPVGNGTVGSLVWTTPSAIKLQVNRVDVFANNSASNNFYERHSDYCNGVGFVEVDFLTDDVFSGSKFRQHLSVHDGLVSIKAGDVECKVLAWQETDVMALHVQDNRTIPEIVHVKLRALRPVESRMGNHLAKSKLTSTGNRIVLTQEFREDDYYCASSTVIEVVGRDATASAENETTLRLTLEGERSAFTVLIASAATFDPAVDITAETVRKLDVAKRKGFESLLASNNSYWRDFWEKSFININSKDGKAALIQKHYYYYLYVMASSSRGAYPPKFNGMLWTTGGDERKWGSLYWGANQSCIYNALFPVNRLDLLKPMFNMYSSMRQSCEVAARQQWGSKGIYIPETVAFDGLASMPEEIASEMRDLYLLRKPWDQRSLAFSEYAFTKMPYLSRWNWKQDEGWKDGRWNISNKGGGAFGHVTHIFSRGAKIAYQYWLAYEYTQDQDWLRDQAYPMLKGIAEFYRNFPNLRKETDGKYHLYYVNDNESVWGGHNTIEEISSMMGILPIAIKASKLLGVDSDLARQWRELLDNLSPLPTSSLVQEGEDKPVTWIRALPPVVKGDGQRIPDPNTLPVWFFDLVTLESDSFTLAIGNQTFDAYFEDSINDSTRVNVLSKLPVAGSLLGRTNATEFLIPNQINSQESRPLINRMDLREGFQTTSVQRLGRAAEALHYALCQSVPSAPGEAPVIRVFPAWPRDWNGDFTLAARGGFLVTSSIRDSEIKFVQIKSNAGSDCRIRNPWTDADVTIFRNGRKWKQAKGSLLMFKTKKGDNFLIVPKGIKH